MRLFIARKRTGLLQFILAGTGLISSVACPPTIGNDLTGNNQFNARPTCGTCGASDFVSTPYGCLDTNPTGKRESIVPFGLGTGPANFIAHIRISKVIGIEPRIEGAFNVL
jgi:hypothetical protein